MEKFTKWALDKSGAAAVGALVTAAINAFQGWATKHPNWSAVLVPLAVAAGLLLLMYGARIWKQREPVTALTPQLMDPEKLEAAELRKKVEGIISWLERAKVGDKLNDYEIRLVKLESSAKHQASD